MGIDPELAAALERLSPRERSVAALRFGADLRTREIAEVLDLSVANVQQIIARALRAAHAARGRCCDEPGRGAIGTLATLASEGARAHES